MYSEEVRLLTCLYGKVSKNKQMRKHTGLLELQNHIDPVYKQNIDKIRFTLRLDLDNGHN